MKHFQNLIATKNLEILNSNSHKNLIYLKANSSFQAGIRENNVTCFKTKEDTIKKKFKLIEKNFNICVEEALESGRGISDSVNYCNGGS